MSAWLDPVRDVLDDVDDSWTRAVFFRDDDVGWDDRALLALLEVFVRRDVPVDLAVIPVATHPHVASSLLRLRRDAAIGLHQHGYAHVDHETQGRKCEFGSSRTPDQLAADVSAGARLLGELFGEHLDPIFTPPWNRCRPELGDVLADAGFEVLSRDSTATPLERPRLAELPVTVDWFGTSKRTKLPFDRADRGRAIAGSLGSGRPVGIMLHHAVCGDGDRADVDELLSVFASSRAVTCRTMRDVAA